MINRANWQQIRFFIHYLESVKQTDPATVKRARGHLRHLLEWADEAPLWKSRTIDPTFPAYLKTARNDGREISLSPSSMIRCLTQARAFYNFARIEWKVTYRPISESWINTLYVARQTRNSADPVAHRFFKLEDVIKIASTPVSNLRERRARAAVCMLFISGMRAEAFASLPISCVNLEEREVYQFPRQGVRTKNRKAATTFLFNIPELFEVVREWDERIRAQLPPEALWFSVLKNFGENLSQQSTAYIGRHSDVEQEVRMICRLAQVKYLSPHKLRHGHVIYALKRVKNIEEYKAVSQNAMHDSIITTDKIYGGLGAEDVKRVILSFGE